MVRTEAGKTGFGVSVVSGRTICALCVALSAAGWGENGAAQDAGVPEGGIHGGESNSAADSAAEHQELAKDAESAAEREAHQRQEQHVRFIVPPSGCVMQDHAQINAPTALHRYFEKHTGNFIAGASGVSALWSEQWFIVPHKQLSNGRPVTQLLTELDNLQAELLGTQTVFESPTELFFEEAHSSASFANVIVGSADFPDFVRRDWKKFRYTLPDGNVVYAFATDENSSTPSPRVVDYERLFASRATAKTPEAESTFYFAAKGMRAGDRVIPFVQDLQRENPESIVLHPGDLLETRLVYDELCVAPLGRAKPKAVSVNTAELAMGPKALGEFARKHRVPFVAANLEEAGGKGLFPRFRVVQIGSLRIAIVGLVDPTLLSSNQSGRITPSVRRQWKISGPIDTLTRVVRELRENERPDALIVLAGSAQGDLTEKLQAAHDVDLVVAGENWQGLYPKRQTVQVGSSRAELRGPRPLGTVVRNKIGVTELDLVFEQGAPTQLIRRDTPILFSAPRDDKLFAERRDREEQWVDRFSRVVLPAAEKVFSKDAELQKLVWGEKILHRNHFDEVTRDEPARWSDPLWMRLVSNSIRERQEVDVVLMRNMDRGSQTVGDLPSLFTAEWLDTPEPLMELELTGADLKRVQTYLDRQNEGRIAPEAYLFAAGMDTRLISGRPLDENRTYRVLVGERVLDLASFEKWEASASRSVTVADAMRAQLETWTGPDGAFDPRYLPDVADMVLPHADRVIPRWEFRLDTLGLRVSQFSNTGDTAQYAATRETRVTTPNNFSLAAALDTALIYDDADIAWETRTKAAYQRVQLADVEREPVDDLLVFTELRLNAVSLSVTDEAWPLVPFAKFEYDTEFTAVDDPAGDGKLPHQHLLREQVGVSLTSPTVFRELRLFGLAQQDVGFGPVYDVGVGAEIKLRLEVSVVVFTSESKVRYFFEDGDDRDIDLGLIIQSVQRIETPLTEWLSIYAFADLFFVRGKTEGFKEVAGSTIIGVGLDAHTVLQL